MVIAAAGSLIFLAVIILITIGAIVTLYGRRASGITAHPSDGRGAAPGSGTRSEVDHDQTEQEHTSADFGTR